MSSGIFRTALTEIPNVIQVNSAEELEHILENAWISFQVVKSCHSFLPPPKHYASVWPCPCCSAGCLSSFRSHVFFISLFVKSGRAHSLRTLSTWLCFITVVWSGRLFQCSDLRLFLLCAVWALVPLLPPCYKSGQMSGWGTSVRTVIISTVGLNPKWLPIYSLGSLYCA